MHKKQTTPPPQKKNPSDLEIEAPVATLPGAWHYRLSAGIGWPSVSILWLGETEIVIYNFYLSVVAYMYN